MAESSLHPRLVWSTHATGSVSRNPVRLVRDGALSCEASPSGEGSWQNLLVHGDNIDALTALAPKLAGQVKCVCIDPPYNTGSAFGQYHDAKAHAAWLQTIREQLVLLRGVLAPQGSLWVSIDDHEVHYLKVLLDELFGRDCFVASVIWRSSDNSNNDAKQFSVDHNYLLVYGKCPGWSPKPQQDLSKRSHFKNPDQDPKGPWFDGNPLNSPKPRPNLRYSIVGPSGFEIPAPPNGWRWSKQTLQKKLDSGEIRFTRDGKGIRRRTYLADMPPLPPSTLWADLEQTGHNRQAKCELKKIFASRPTSELFATPKPEKMVARVLELATDPDDLVLDAFAGSGTTGAVAHKMGRRWVMIEQQSHNVKDVATRLHKVVQGEDRGGVSSRYAWRGGGGFRVVSCKAR